MNIITLPTGYYQQFDADYSLDVPGEGYGGWKKRDLRLNLNKSAVVLMHAWDCGPEAQFPGVYRACEYLPRSYDICENVLPGLLAAIRNSPLQLVHVVAGTRPGLKNYGSDYPGYRIVKELAGPTPPEEERVKSDEVAKEMLEFQSDHAWPGVQNAMDTYELSPRVTTFPKQAEPVGDEPLVESSHELFEVCKHFGINHLIYIGFCINACIPIAACGMVDMKRRGIICSTIKQAVTAVENKESARAEGNKAHALWQVSITYGFVYDINDFVAGISQV